MASEPKKRHSKAQKRTRRASIHLAAISLVNCKNCGEKTISHQACRSCGFYGGQKSADIKPQVKITRA
jgi:large subunit ribosomal protein L32